MKNFDDFLASAFVIYAVTVSLTFVLCLTIFLVLGG